ncbi:MAG: hypothetical protein AB1473_24045 [Thermodesulfobacteriota bacterium]
MMRSTVYPRVAMSFFALVLTLAFATAPGIAASQEESATPMGSGITQGTTGDVKAGGTGEVSGQTKEGMPERMRGMMSEEMKAQMMERMKGQMKGEAKTGASGRSEAEVSGEAKGGATGHAPTGVSGQPRVGVSGETRGGVLAGQERAPAARTETSARVAGGEAVVVRVDRPDNCLRIRSGPSMSHNMIGCAVMGQALVLTGVFSTDGRWAQLDNNGWVTFRQVRTALKPPKRTVKRVRTSESDFDEPWERPAGAGASATVSSEPYYDTDYVSYGVPYYSYYGWPGYVARRPALPRPPALPALPPPPRPFP